ncbi:MAG: transcriptional regulator BetI [Hoeflea sp.]|uniref:transcriptional regulator BetI n=1 Tax=Hoeflea sp. TaxID=1940281 RepID=UPI001D7BD6BB|nr:transcriptional regulator BetI [Hoeflea sp.]MBU4527890.1 transcriptional regulator BetI [Alphaproteobacteria bacterium]MBU4546075.1 transcriptional regulator BetI [Alphaproteobacteria bacterium]MBU4553240.1 transcriptional regulator BetI [Alphaproteobacteria bacterium]MBV1724312.1 transcriptional regulator BetI [Hoeflea sp.]MBV1759997.1 transcriptional regulator BetI [Hoeflea sp.]
MPKIGMEPIRRKALTDAAIEAIGARGSMDVTMSDIAGRAGVSAALAHHYFGSKEQLITESVRALLRELRGDAEQALKAAGSNRARVSAIIAVSFSDKQFSDEVVAAWLAFYVDAHRAPEIRRLLSIYARRLHSNLMSGLSPLAGESDGQRIAEGAAAMIDGLYIRKALGTGPARHDAVALVEDHIETQLSDIRRRTV